MARIYSEVAEGRFLVHKVLPKAVRLFFRRPLTYAAWTWGTTFILLLLTGGLIPVLEPPLRLDVHAPDDASPLAIIARVAVAVAPFLTLFAIASAVGAICLRVAWRDLSGKQEPLRSAIGAGFSRLFPMFLLTSLAGGGLIVGFVLYLIPGLFLTSMWAVAGPACVVERLGPLDSLARSRKLTKGFRWRLLGLSALLCASCPVLILLGAALERQFLSSGWPLAGPMVVGGLIELMTMSFFCFCSVVAYHDLRVAKEGVDLEGVAAVFD